jgi:hypothetical protein
MLIVQTCFNQYVVLFLCPSVFGESIKKLTKKIKNNNNDDVLCDGWRQ